MATCWTPLRTLFSRTTKPEHSDTVPLNGNMSKADQFNEVTAPSLVLNLIRHSLSKHQGQVHAHHNVPCEPFQSDEKSIWLIDDDNDKPPAYHRLSGENKSPWLGEDIKRTIDECIDELDPALRELSLKIHGTHFWLEFKLDLNDKSDHPELGFEEQYVSVRKY